MSGEGSEVGAVPAMAATRSVAERARAIRDAITVLEIDLHAETAAYDAAAAKSIADARSAEAAERHARQLYEKRLGAQQQRVRDLAAALTPQCLDLGTREQRKMLLEAQLQLDGMRWSRALPITRSDITHLFGDIRILMQRIRTIKCKLARYKQELAKLTSTAHAT
jgi:hypothetical protein